MAICPDCGPGTCVRVNQHHTCTKCGLQVRFSPTYVQEYDAVPNRRKTYYSRMKRFVKQIQSSRHPIPRQNLADLLTLYSLLEFGHGVYYTGPRKYFFSMKIVVFCLARLAGLDLDLPLLKNPVRTERQLRSIAHIFEQCQVAGFYLPPG